MQTATARRVSQRARFRPAVVFHRASAVRPLVPRLSPLARLVALDDRILRRVVQTRRRAVTFSLKVLCRLLDPDMVTMAIAVLVLGGATAFAEHVALALVAVSTCVVVIKRTVKRARPTCDVQALVPPDRFSFPSGHTAAAFAVAISVFPVAPTLVPVLVAVAVLVGYARMYLGVHYPIDVAAGAGLGVFVGSLAALL